MAIGRKRKWIVAAWIAVAILVAVVVSGEFVARSQLEGRIAAFGDSLTGVSTSLTGGSALMQLARGRVDVDLAISDSALGTYVACRTDQDLTVHTVEGGLIVTTERTVRGMTLPVEVLLVAQRDGDGWSLVADSVSAAGVSIPAKRALKILTGRDGSGSTLANRLLDGIQLPKDERMAITSVRFTDGEAHLTASTSIHPTDGATGDGLGGLRECLESQEG